MRAAILLLLASLAVAAPARPRRAPPLPTGELVLDMAAPFVTATIAGVTLRLEVALDTRDTVELNPDAAARLPLAYEADGGLEVGRVLLAGRQAHAEAIVAGKPAMIVVSTHDRACCTRADGTIGPEQLPFARVRFVRAGVTAGTLRRYPAVVSAAAGLSATARIGDEPVAIKLAPAATATVATASAGAIAARAGGGRWDGPQHAARLAFGVERPVRPLRLARPLAPLGLPLETMLVRIADFRGGRALPQDAIAPGDLIVQAAHRPSQHDWPAIVLGRDQLDACAQIVVERVPEPALALDCGGGG